MKIHGVLLQHSFLGWITPRVITVLSGVRPRSNLLTNAVELSNKFPKQGDAMNWDQIEGKWKELKGSVKERWGKLTDDDLNVIGGKKDQLVGHIQERYGIARDEAQKQVDDWNAQQAKENQEELDNRFNRKAS
jgi:uncharacterized protein YjbJ (UPF0337 family)